MRVAEPVRAAVGCDLHRRLEERKKEINKNEKKARRISLEMMRGGEEERAATREKRRKGRDEETGDGEKNWREEMKSQRRPNNELERRDGEARGERDI